MFELEVTSIDLFYLNKLKYQQLIIIRKTNILFVAVVKPFNFCGFDSS